MKLMPLVLKFPDWMYELDKKFESKSACANNLKPQLVKYRHEYANWRSSIEQDRLTLTLDVKDFAPSELIVRTTESTIVVEGRHSKKEHEHKNISRHFIRKYILPKGVNANDMTTALSADGVLTIKAPPKPPVLVQNSNTESIKR